MLANESKCDPPVTADLYRPYARTITDKLMKRQTWQVHVFGTRGSIEPTQDETKPRSMFGLNSGLAPFKEELLQAFVNEAANHASHRTPLRYWLQHVTAR